MLETTVQAERQMQIHVAAPPNVQTVPFTHEYINNMENNENHGVENGKAVMHAVETAVLSLSRVGDVDDLETWIRDSRITAKGGDDILKLKEIIDRLSKALRAKYNKPPALRSTNGALSRLEDYFLFRHGGHSMTLLAPVEIPFNIGSSLKRKVFGFVRCYGNYYPLICSISGLSAQASNHNHPKLLDSELWTEQVYRFGSFYRHSFRSGGFDEHFGYPKGASFASHVEPKLMLWYACRLFTKLNGGEPLPLDDQVDMLPGGLKLLIGSTQPKADVVVSRAACTDCEKFRLLMKKKTGIEFNFIVIANLGKLKEGRDEKGLHKYMASEENDGENRGGEMMLNLVPSSFQIVIHQKREVEPSAIKSSQKGPQCQKESQSLISQKHKTRISTDVVVEASYTTENIRQRKQVNSVSCSKRDNELSGIANESDTQAMGNNMERNYAKRSGENKVHCPQQLSLKRIRKVMEEEDVIELLNESALQASIHFVPKKKLRKRRGPDPLAFSSVPGSPISIDSDSERS